MTVFFCLNSSILSKLKTQIRDHRHIHNYQYIPAHSHLVYDHIPYLTGSFSFPFLINPQDEILIIATQKRDATHCIAQSSVLLYALDAVYAFVFLIDNAYCTRETLSLQDVQSHKTHIRDTPTKILRIQETPKHSRPTTQHPIVFESFPLLPQHYATLDCPQRSVLLECSRYLSGRLQSHAFHLYCMPYFDTLDTRTTDSKPPSQFDPFLFFSSLAQHCSSYHKTPNQTEKKQLAVQLLSLQKKQGLSQSQVSILKELAWHYHAREQVLPNFLPTFSFEQACAHCRDTPHSTHIPHP